MSVEICNLYLAAFAIALLRLVVTLPSGRQYQVPRGHVFLTSPDVAHTAALAKLCRRADADFDSDAPCSGDKNLFEQHRGRFFNLPYSEAQLQLAVAIEAYREPPKPIVIDCAERGGTAPPAPTQVSGFER